MAKRVRFDDEARHALWRGADQLACAVRLTLGPRGRSVCVDRGHGATAITRDGVAVATEIELPDPFENLGARMLREAALRTGVEAGDGTSTATVLAHRMVGEGLMAVAQGARPVVVQRGIERSLAFAMRALSERAHPVRTRRELVRVAVLAAGDRALGEKVAEAFERVGHGVITVEDGPTTETVLDVVEGVRFSGGYASPYFVNDAEEMEASLDHPLLLLVDGVLDQVADVVPALSEAQRQRRPLAVIAERVEGDALSTLVVNRLRGVATSVAIQLHGTSSARRECLEDLALVTGATLIAADLGRSPAGCLAEWLGRARHLTVGTEQGTLLQGGGRGSEREAALDATRDMLGSARSDHERAALAARVSRLAGGLAVLRAGAPTEVERHAVRSRLEDAVAATRAALEEGVLPGGGSELLRLADLMRVVEVAERERHGREAFVRALEEPLRTIAANAAAEPGAVVAQVRGAGPRGGWNAVTGACADFETEGILDPVRVLRLALTHASSVAGLVLSTDALVVDDDPRAA